MLFEFAATLIAGVALAGIALGAVKMSRGRLPKWIVPAAGGIGILCTTIYAEYVWAENTVPADAVVVERAYSQSPFKPWSYAWPVVSGVLYAKDISITDTNNVYSGYIIAASRWKESSGVLVRVNCNQSTIARALTDGSYEPEEMLARGETILQAFCQA